MKSAEICHETEVSGSNRSLAGKKLVFKLADEFYGVDILKVKEIIKVMKPARIPKAPDYVKGVINLRGKIIPVFSLRKKFGLDDVLETQRSCIVVFQAEEEAKAITAGMLVDEVHEVIEIEKDQIEPLDALYGNWQLDYISSVGKVQNKVILLFDVTKLLFEKTFSISELKGDDICSKI